MSGSILSLSPLVDALAVQRVLAGQVFPWEDSFVKPGAEARTLDWRLETAD